VSLVLLDKRANPNIQDNDGWTPLHVAAYWEKKLIFEPLLTYGADLELVNKDNETALDVTDDAETREKLEGKLSFIEDEALLLLTIFDLCARVFTGLREKFKKKKSLSRSNSNSSALRRGMKIGKLNMKRQNEEDEFPKSPTND